MLNFTTHRSHSREYHSIALANLIPFIKVNLAYMFHNRMISPLTYEGENCIKYVNSYLMNCTMNIFEALSREINLNCYGV